MRASSTVLLALLAAAPTTAPSPPAAAASASDAARPGTSPEADALSATIRSLEAMGNRFTHEKQWEAARWVAGRLSALGLETVITPYEHDGRSWPNVTASVRGTASPDERVLVIAHLDSVCAERPTEAPGADDDGSGVAVLLDVARRHAGLRHARTVQLVVFSNEEQGHLGSKHFAHAARASGERIVAVLNLDTLGYPPPSSVADWAALRRIGSATRALAALGTMVRNYAKTIVKPGGLVDVVGRPANSSLVGRVASSLRPHLDVREVVKEDCG